MRIPLLSGVVADELAEFKTSYPVNLEPVAVQNKIAAGQLRMTAGSIPFATGPGNDRGGICWNDTLYRVMGTRLVKVAKDGTVTDLGDVGTDFLPAKFDYSFDRLGIRSGTNLYYYDGTALTQVTNVNLGPVLDFIWIDGYFMTTDGNDIVTTELSDPTNVLPLKYGSAEQDPDNITGLIKLRNEAYVCGENTIEVLQDVGGSGFPFQSIPYATIPYGCVGPMAKVRFGFSFAFVGCARNEGLGVFLAGYGDAQRISNRLIEDELTAVSDPTSIILESRVARGEQRLFIHLPTKSLVYLQTASAMLGQPAWYVAQSGVGNPYRQRFAVKAYGKLIVGDTQSPQLAALSDTVATQFGEEAQWQFDVGLVYNSGIGGTVHTVELIGLPGRAPSGVDASAFMCMTRDGETFTTERPLPMGLAGQRRKRMQWRPRSTFRNYIGFRFRGLSSVLPGFAACEANITPLGA
jgi:hypothetical protein